MPSAPPNPEDFPENTSSAPPPNWRVWGWRLLTACFLIALVAAALLLPGAWRETQRREAYLPQLETLAHRNPYEGRLLALLGGRQAQAYEFPTAAQTLERAAATGETSPALWQTLAASAAVSGDQRATAILKVAAHDHPSPALQAALARVQALGPHPDDRVLASAISPQGVTPLLEGYAGGSVFNRAVSWWGRHHPDESGFETRRAWAQEAPEDAQAQRLWGLALMRNRRLPEAEAPLLKAVTLAPHSAAAHLALADLRDAQGEMAPAVLEYLEALKRRPGWADALLGLGRNALALGLPASAADVYAQAVQAAPRSAEAWAGLGRANVQANQNDDQALKAFETAARLAPPQTDFFNSYASLLQKNGRSGEAEALLRRRLTAAPGDAYAHYLLGSVLLDSSTAPARATEAEAQTREALRLAPAAPAPQRQLAQILIDRGQSADAIVALKAALAEEPGDVKTMQTLARALQKNGQPAQARTLAMQAKARFDALQAIDVLKSRLQKAPGDLDAHRRLAIMYRQTNQPDMARQEQGILALMHTHPELTGQGTQTLETLIHDTLILH